MKLNNSRFKSNIAYFSKNDGFSHFIQRPVSSKWRKMFKNWKSFSSKHYDIQKNLSVFTHLLQIGRNKVIFRGTMFRFRNDCYSHPIKVIVYIKWRWILWNWERILFTTYLSTITSFIFHTGATVQQQQHQLYRPFFMFSKGLFQPSTSKNCFGQMEFKLTKLKYFFIPNRTIIQNLL